MKEAGYETEIVSGVTSFRAAARLEMDIASKAQQIHIITGFLSDRGGAAASRHRKHEAQEEVFRK